MKKHICLLLMLTLCAALCGCRQREPETPNTIAMQATVKTIENQVMTVEPLPGSPQLASGDAFRVPLQNMAPSPEPEIGDTVEIVYSGDILESYPAEFERILKVSVLSKAPENTPETEPAPESSANRVAVGGPYGELSVMLPDDWTCKICPVGDKEPGISVYGLRLIPSSGGGTIELGYTNFFGVCGTGLSQKSVRLAGRDAIIGTYDHHKSWDYVFIPLSAEGLAGIVAQPIRESDSWPEDFALDLLDTIRFDPAKTEGAIELYSPDSELEEIGLAVRLTDVSATGLTIHFRQYAAEQSGELLFGEAYSLQKKSADAWEKMLPLSCDYGFTDEATLIPSEGEAEQIVNWEGLYGKLAPGEYRIVKQILGHRAPGDNDLYEISPHFLIAGEPDA